MTKITEQYNIISNGLTAGGAVIKADDNNADDILDIVQKLEMLRASAPEEYGYIKGFINCLAMKNSEGGHGKKQLDGKKEGNET